jgi:hypothetical protein
MLRFSRCRVTEPKLNAALTDAGLEAHGRARNYEISAYCLQHLLRRSLHYSVKRVAQQRGLELDS